MYCASESLCDIIIKLEFAGIDFKMKTIEVDGVKIRVQIW